MSKENENLKFENLVKESKEKLEVIKLALEIASHHQRTMAETRKYRSSNWLLFAMAIVTALSGLGTTYIIKSWDYEHSDRDRLVARVDGLITSFLGSTDPSTRKGFACELANLNRAEAVPEIKSKTEQYVQICATIEATFQEIKEQTEQIEKVDTTSRQTQKFIAQISKLEKEINSLQTQKENSTSTDQRATYDNKIAAANEKIMAVVDSSSVLPSAVKSSEKINNNVKQQVRAFSLPDNSNKSSDVRWLKEGYFQQFEDIRILLQYLDKNNKEIQVEVCHTTSTTRCEKPVVTKAWVSIYKPLEFMVDQKKYRLVLQAIDRAGKNPFNLAAYITLEKG